MVFVKEFFRGFRGEVRECGVGCLWFIVGVNLSFGWFLVFKV